LANNQVVVHFNDAPDHKLDFSGFGKDDRIEIDVQAFKTNGFTHIGSAVTNTVFNSGGTDRSEASSSRYIEFDTITRFGVSASFRSDENKATVNTLRVSSRVADVWKVATLADFGAANSDSGNTIINGYGGVMNRVSFVNAGGVAAQDIHVVVDASGAFVDTNADGVLQSSEAVDANRAFADGNDLVNLAANHVTIRFNDAPDKALNFQGFGADDKVEINLSELSRNGWVIGTPTRSRLSRDDSWTDDTSASSSLIQAGATINGRDYYFKISAERSSESATLSIYNRYFDSSGCSTVQRAELATFGDSGRGEIIDGQGGLMHQVSFVHNPTIHVVVEASGAYIDTNANGVLDATEAVDGNRAFFEDQDLVDLAHNTVVVKFNDAPDQALNFAGFGRDDRIEIDLSALQANGWKVDGNNVTDHWRGNDASASYCHNAYESSLGISGQTPNGKDFTFQASANSLGQRAQHTIEQPP
jgi:hypothetical protein